MIHLCVKEKSCVNQFIALLFQVCRKKNTNLLIQQRAKSEPVKMFVIVSYCNTDSVIFSASSLIQCHLLCWMHKGMHLLYISLIKTLIVGELSNAFINGCLDVACRFNLNFCVAQVITTSLLLLPHFPSPPPPPEEMEKPSKNPLLLSHRDPLRPSTALRLLHSTPRQPVPTRQMSRWLVPAPVSVPAPMPVGTLMPPTQPPPRYCLSASPALWHLLSKPQMPQVPRTKGWLFYDAFTLCLCSTECWVILYLESLLLYFM